MFNELRIPVLSPRYIKAKELPIAKHLPVIKNLDLRYGVFITLLYDVGTVFNHDENIFGKKFQAGTGIGVILIAPFGYALRADWAVRLSKPAIGQLVLNLYAKF
jgi:Na+/H+ antiporter NhaC